MRLALMLAAVLAFVGPSFGQQNQQLPHPQPIPNWPPPQEPELGWHATAVAVPPCAIFKPDGKRYRYLEGNLPNGIKSKKRFTDTELQKVRDRGGNFRILKSGSTKSEVDAALDACLKEGARQER
ncbi:MAG TPA: hypothetical protein VN822_07175 [Candidatus Acidoferrales bacterium]|nr:hypothetical protein [Candidatus Acidoferrales bacterium]